jgi:Flp pilus assembly secretin CpaC
VADVPRSPDLILSQGMSKPIKVARPFKTIHISDPEVIDMVTVTDQLAIVVPKKPGRTNVLFLDASPAVVTGMNVSVENYPAYGDVEVHNKALLTSATNFRCGETGCHFVDETTVKEPAALPRGHSENTTTTDNTNLNINK